MFCFIQACVVSKKTSDHSSLFLSYIMWLFCLAHFESSFLFRCFYSFIVMCLIVISMCIFIVISMCILSLFRGRVYWYFWIYIFVVVVTAVAIVICSFWVKSLKIPSFVSFLYYPDLFLKLSILSHVIEALFVFWGDVGGVL
jgi:hypothetical protein